MIRVQYKKLGDITYISHLDIVKLMERISRRAGIRLSYSQGFSPHPKTSFSPALSVGMGSLCEFLDLELEDESIDLQELLDRYNEASVEGIEFTKAVKLEEKTKSIVAFLTHSTYEYDFLYYSDEDYKKIENIVDDIKNQKEIILQRTSKSGNFIDYDLKELIVEIEALKDSKKIRTTIFTSSSQNLNPRALLNYIINSADIKEDEYIGITKIDTFHMDEEGNISYPV